MDNTVRKLSKIALAFIGSLFLSSCIQLSPQQVELTPSIKVSDVMQGAGTASLTVVDARASKVIGHRGGVYKETATIVSKYALDETISNLASKVLAKAGIELSSSFPDIAMEITLDELSYGSEEVKTSVMRTTVAAVISINVTKGNKVFKNSYRSSQYVETVGYPKQEKNSEILNNVFNSVLDRLFSDGELESFIGQ